MRRTWNGLAAALAITGMIGCNNNRNDDDRAESDMSMSMDQEFVNEAASGGMFEVRSSELAMDMASSQETRDFAQQMIDGHSQANGELRRIAQREGFGVPGQMMEKHSGKIARLREMQGERFDRRYHEMQVEAHDEAIALFERASRECRNEDLREFAADTLPTLRDHRRMLREHTHTNVR